MTNIQTEIVAALIATTKVKHIYTVDDVERCVTHNLLKYPLAQNVSEGNLEALAARWLR